MLICYISLHYNLQDSKERRMINKICCLVAVFFVCACSPTVKIEAPEKPIEINLNVNVKLEIQKDVKQAIAKNKDIF